MALMFQKILLCWCIYLLLCRIFSLHEYLDDATPIGSFKAFTKYSLVCISNIFSYEQGKIKITNFLH